MEDGDGYAQRNCPQEIVRNPAVASFSIRRGAKLLLRIQIQAKPVPYGAGSAVPLTRNRPLIYFIFPFPGTKSIGIKTAGIYRLFRYN